MQAGLSSGQTSKASSYVLVLTYDSLCVLVPILLGRAVFGSRQRRTNRRPTTEGRPKGLQPKVLTDENFWSSRTGALDTRRSPKDRQDAEGQGVTVAFGAGETQANL